VFDMHTIIYCFTSSSSDSLSYKTGIRISLLSLPLNT